MCGRATRHARRAAVLAAVVASLFATVPSRASAEGHDLSVDVNGVNGVGRISTPGRPCAEGGDGAYWHYDYEAPLPTTPGTGRFSALPGQLRLHVDLHSEDGETKITPAPSARQVAFLRGEESHASLINERGTVKIRLQSGTCTSPTLAFDGSTASGGGTWRVEGGDGAYRGSTGTGNFVLSAAVAPGADNPFTVQLGGAVNVLQPGLKVEFKRAYWGFLGADYLLRRVTVVYRITNVGTGDSFGAALTRATSPAAGDGVEDLGPTPQALGDLLEGESEEVRVRYQMGTTPGSPCELVVLGCEFDTEVEVDLPDARDRPALSSAPVRVKAPDFPPPL